MGDQAMQEAKQTAAPPKARATHEPARTPRAVANDDAMAPLEGIAKQLEGPDGTHAVTEGEHREGVVQQIFSVRDALFDSLREGMKRGEDAIDVDETPASATALMELLGFAASMVIAGAAGASVVWLSTKVFAKIASSASEGSKAAAKRREKFFEDGLKDGIKKAFRFDPGKPSGSLHELKQAFKDELQRQCGIAKERLSTEWSRMHDHLLTLPTTELEQLCNQLTQSASADPGPLLDTVADHTVVAWANFVARANHGAMRGWDDWERNGGPGAVKLPDASDPLANDGDLRATIANGNVDPAAIDPLLAQSQRIDLKDHSGLLQISLDESGRLIRDTGYGLRLDGVGPGVRGRIRAMGDVRDLKVNKIVRICSWRLNPPVPIASFLITADGYIRRSSLGELSLVHIDPAANKRDCLTDLIHGKESVDCHVAHDANDAQLATFAEWAQRQPLADLEP